jgi:hypothetical protein
MIPARPEPSSHPAPLPASVHLLHLHDWTEHGEIIALACACGSVVYLHLKEQPREPLDPPRGTCEGCGAVWEVAGVICTRVPEGGAQ